MDRLHVIQKLSHIDKSLVGRSIAEPLNVVHMRFMMEPVIFTLEVVIVELAIWVGAYVRLEVRQDVLSHARVSATFLRSTTGLTYFHLRSDVVT
jgi:hypothetical protein